VLGEELIYRNGRVLGRLVIVRGGVMSIEVLVLWWGTSAFSGGAVG